MAEFILNMTPNHALWTDKVDLLNPPQKTKVKIVDKYNKIKFRQGDELIVMTQPQNWSEGDNKYKRFALSLKARINGVDEAREAFIDELNDSEKGDYYNSRKPNAKRSLVHYFTHEIEVGIDGIFEPDTLLDDYTYSLLGIRNFHDSYTHFVRKYTNLKSFDYETLYNEWLYGSRTLFGRLFYALPQENQLEFVLKAHLDFETPDLSSISCNEGLKYLRKYIESHVVSMGNFLIDIDRMINEEFQDEIPQKNEIGFAFDIPNSKIQGDFGGNSIREQAELFKEAFINKEEVENTIDLVLGDRQKMESETRFIKGFKDKPWPINIRV